MKSFTLALVAITALVALVMGMAVMQTAPEKGTVPLSINAFPNGYSLFMSSTPGIGLTPAYPASIDNSTVSFRWQTNYGRLLSWNADSTITELDKEVTMGDGKIFWSYVDEESKFARPPVQISLAMIDKATGKTLGTASLDIGWTDRDFAVVKA